MTCHHCRQGGANYTVTFTHKGSSAKRQLCKECYYRIPPERRYTHLVVKERGKHGEADQP